MQSEQILANVVLGIILAAGAISVAGFAVWFVGHEVVRVIGVYKEVKSKIKRML